MRIKLVALLFLGVISAQLVADEAILGHTQSTTGDQSPAIFSEGDVNLNYYGLTEQQFSDMLKA